MSKYADIEQIKELIRTEWCKYMPSDLDVNLSFVLGKISEIPTIEVMEYPQVEGITPKLVTTEVSEEEETPTCSGCDRYEDHHTSLACANCPVITKTWGGAEAEIIEKRVACDRKDTDCTVCFKEAHCKALAKAEQEESEWILECDAEGEGDNLYRCLKCGRRLGCQEYDLPNYCPNCGADMRGETE